MYKAILFLLSSFLILSCSNVKQAEESITEVDLRALADSLAKEYIITDGHIDLPYRLRTRNFRLEKEYLGIPISTDDGDFDFERAKEGGLDAPFMSIYIPAEYQTQGGAKELADSLIDMVHGIIDVHPDYFASGGSPQEVEKNFEKGLLSLPMGMENGAPVEDDLANIQYFFDRGIRYITLTHSKDNQICDSSYDDTRTWNGLSPFGVEVVKEMNRVGIMVDISHVSDSTFYQVMNITDVPVIASHSSARYFTPGFERNMSDDMLKALAVNGGVIQINFGSSFLDSAVVNANERNRAKLAALRKESELGTNDEVDQAVIDEFIKNNPTLYADVEKVADHIDRVVEFAGIDHVGIGSDYDGVGDSLPTGLKDVSDYPNLIFELLKRGYSPEDIEKICYKNIWRVWNKVNEVANNS